MTLRKMNTVDDVETDAYKHACGISNRDKKTSGLAKPGASPKAVCTPK